MKQRKERIERQRTISGLPLKEGVYKVKQSGVIKRRRRKSTNKQVFTRVAIGILSALVGICIIIIGIWGYIFSGLITDKNANSYPTEALTNPPPSSKDITNILLLGVDAKDPKTEKGLSDSIIILTIDRKNNVIKMTSILRDSYTYIPGQDKPNKINAAHNFGGPVLAMRTVNNAFRLNIEKYIVVNMFSMEDIIDIAGGVSLTITRREYMELNHMLRNVYPQLGSSILLSGDGLQKMNGKQAVMFARIRKIDSDIARTRRQRDLLKALFAGFKDTNPIRKAQMIQSGLASLQTNMTAKEITSLGIDVLPRMDDEIQELHLPIQGYYKVYASPIWFMLVDYNAMIPKVYEFIYGETHPFDRVPTIHVARNNTAVNTPQPTPTKTLPADEQPEPTQDQNVSLTPDISLEPSQEPSISIMPPTPTDEPMITIPAPTVTSEATPTDSITPTPDESEILTNMGKN